MKAIKQNIKELEDNIVELLNSPNDTFSMDTFHDLRVEIKQLNALMDVIEFCSKDFKRKKTFKPFKEIFHQAGIVREIQLEEEELNDHFSSKSEINYLQQLNEHLLSEKSIFFSLLDQKRMDKIKRKFEIIEPNIDHITKKKTTKYLDKKRKSIEKLLSKDIIQTKDLHKLRKRLKLYNYNSDYLFPEKQEENSADNVDLTGLLGEWHDRQVMLNHLEKTLHSNAKDAKEITQMTHLKSKITAERNELLKKIEEAKLLSIFYKPQK